MKMNAAVITILIVVVMMTNQAVGFHNSEESRYLTVPAIEFPTECTKVTDLSAHKTESQLRRNNSRLSQPQCSDTAGTQFCGINQTPLDKSLGKRPPFATASISSSSTDVLANATSTGMSSKTSQGYRYEETGISASERAAREDFGRAKRYASDFAKAAEATGMNKYVLAAIASRESRVGSALRNGWGKDEYGMMQIHKNYHVIDQSDGPTSFVNILQGAEILKDALQRVKFKFPTWNEGHQLRGGIAAYNFGVKNVQTVSGTDKGTTGNDYSSDVIARAKYFERNSL